MPAKRTALIGSLPRAARRLARGRARARARASASRRRRRPACTRRRISSQMRTGSVLTVGPARKIDSTTSSNEVTKANTAPPTTPGRISGSVTVRKMRTSPAPRPAAASGSRRSSAVERNADVQHDEGQREHRVRDDQRRSSCRRGPWRAPCCRARPRARSPASPPGRGTGRSAARGRAGPLRAMPSAAAVPAARPTRAA